MIGEKWLYIEIGCVNLRQWHSPTSEKCNHSSQPDPIGHWVIVVYTVITLTSPIEPVLLNKRRMPLYPPERCMWIKRLFRLTWQFGKELNHTKGINSEGASPATIAS